MLDADVKAQLEGIVAAAQPRADNLTDIAGLADPGESHILYWNVATGQFEFINLNTGLVIDADKLTLADNLVDLAEIADPAGSRLFFWRQSTGKFEFVTLGAGLSLVGNVLSAAGGGGDVPTIAYGDFEPAISEPDNLSDYDVGTMRFLRLADQVHVQGHIVLTADADNPARIDLELPISSALGTVDDLGGNATAVLDNGEIAPVAIVVANTDSGTARIKFSGVADLAIDFYYTFSYKVI